MLRCREGDLAIVLTGPYLGFTVRVVGFVGDMIAPATPTGELVNGKSLWRIRNRGIERELSPSKVLMEDKNLQPIRGPRAEQTTTTKKEIPQ
jgi:hypothetical protein